MKSCTPKSVAVNSVCKKTYLLFILALLMSFGTGTPGSQAAESGNVETEANSNSAVAAAVPQTEKQVDVESSSTAGGWSESDFYTRYLAQRLELGLLVRTISLTDSDSGARGGGQGSGTFLGTIYALDEVQNYFPTVHARYFFSKYFGIDLAYNSIHADTVAPSAYTTVKTDGEVSLAGPAISLVGRYDLESGFTPWISIGAGFYSGDFDEAADWALGYYDPAVYAAAGSPSTSYNGVTRVMDVENEVAFIVSAGVAYHLAQHWAIDLSLQYTAVEADAVYRSYQYDTLTDVQEGAFPLDNIAYQIGLSYTF